MGDPRRILEEAGLDPVLVAGECGVVDLGDVAVLPAPAWLRRIWIGPVGAMALPGRIYVDPETLHGDHDRLGMLIVHELAHVGQWRRLGVLGFLVRYLGGYLARRLRGASHGESYRAIRLEREADEVVRRVTGR